MRRKQCLGSYARTLTPELKTIEKALQVPYPLIELLNTPLLKWPKRAKLRHWLHTSKTKPGGHSPTKLLFIQFFPELAHHMPFSNKVQLHKVRKLCREPLCVNPCHHLPTPMMGNDPNHWLNYLGLNPPIDITTLDDVDLSTIPDFASLHSIFPELTEDQLRALIPIEYRRKFK